jgi:hypothetical protein
VRRRWGRCQVLIPAAELRCRLPRLSEPRRRDPAAPAPSGLPRSHRPSSVPSACPGFRRARRDGLPPLLHLADLQLRHQRESLINPALGERVILHRSVGVGERVVEVEAVRGANQFRQDLLYVPSQVLVNFLQVTVVPRDPPAVISLDYSA